MYSGTEGLLLCVVVTIIQLCTFVATVTYSVACMKKKIEDITLNDHELNQAPIISYPEKPMFPVTSSTRVAASEVDVELNLDGPGGDQSLAPQQPVIEVSNNAAPEKDVKSICYAGANKESISKAPSKKSRRKVKEKRNEKGPQTSSAEKVQSSRRIRSNEKDEVDYRLLFD